LRQHCNNRAVLERPETDPFPGFEPKPIEARIELITPEVAAEYLKLNIDNNRTLYPKRVDRYAREMREGRWEPTNQGLAFNVNGQLIDGQHRLHAVIQSGVSVSMLVTRNLPVSAVSKIDTGRARSASDLLKLEDVATKNYVGCSAIARQALSWDKGERWFSNYDASNEEIVQYFVANRDLIERGAEIGKSGARRIKMKPALLGLAYYLCARVDREAAERFFVTQVVEALGLEPGAPAKALRDKIDADAAAKLAGPRHDFDLLATTISAWNKYRAGAQAKTLRPPKIGWTKDNYPTPR
jgi:hypothetical protein